MKKLFLFASVLLMMFSCKRETVTKALPVIVINTPVNNQHFSNGDTIHITGTVTHTVELTEVAVHMTDMSNNSEFFHNHFSAGNKTFYAFDSKYMLPDDKKTTYKVEVEADDKDGNTTTKELTITIN
jgi:Domain of unknown function (DUF4625)